MEPWLDGLSEEWDSDPHGVSARTSLQGRDNSSRRVSTVHSQSRIPHLAHNIRNASSNSTYLKPRSSRGIARMKENNALGERSASSLNAMPQSPNDVSRRRTSSTLPVPRRASSVLSDSQASVQHHTIDKSALTTHDTPEWKRRLKENTEIASDGFDLFSPSKLEGMFKQSSCPAEPENDENDDSVLVSERKQPWNILSDSTFPLPPSSTYPSHRTTKSRPSGMQPLPELDEEDDENDYDMSAISSDIVKGSEIRGIVRRRVSNLELADSTNLPKTSMRSRHDPRMRTISGRKEISDEVFSPLEDSERSSIRKQALQDTLSANPLELRRRLREARKQSHRRSSSTSSDRDISYDAEGLNDQDQSILPEDPVPELTSQSLPEDLSMGTQNYQPNSILEAVTNRQTSVVHRKPSFAADTSQLDGSRDFRSSPPPYRNEKIEYSRISMSEPASPVDTSVVHHAPTSGQHSTAGSPLKLFGNRDTYTNNKLMRILNHFEEEQLELDEPGDAVNFRMSNFGQGELDGFGFDQQVERPPVKEQAQDDDMDKVFKNLDSLALDDRKLDEANTDPTFAKERSPKRRRTLLKDEIFVDGAEIEVKLSHVPDNSLAGKKRRDALPGKDPEQASPDTLASRQIRRPSGSRKSSDKGHSRTTSASEVLQHATVTTPEFQERLADELASFAEKAVEVKQDSRKASFATKDYMEEANKVMEFIRARGKPKPPMPHIQEPEEESELNPDAILDLELEEDSTKDSFSRPPSREGRYPLKPNRRLAQHDPQTASHLKRFQDPDDLELLASTSAIGTLHLVDNQAVEEAALVPVPEDEPLEIGDSFQSDPPGMRILTDNDKKRKHSATDTDQHDSQNVHSESSKRTINTTSSTSSGNRGVISQGTVSIPDTIGIMTFDKQNKTWVRQKIKTPRLPAPSASPESRVGRPELSEADPFDGIPDLSIDETKEASWKKSPKHKLAGTVSVEPQQYSKQIQPTGPESTMALKSSLRSPKRQQRHLTEDQRPMSAGTKASKHEERLHNGVPSKDVGTPDKQARVVTIAFSSPIASEIPYVAPPSMSSAEFDEDDPSLLPLDDDGSVLGSSPAKSPEEPVREVDDDFGIQRPVMGSIERHEQYRAMTLNRRPVSRIEEYDEEEPEENQELSLIHVKHTDMTPLPAKQVSLTKTSVVKESSILCLTPLSEFTLHQVDKLNHPEESYVAERANSKALRQAHGSHALVEDALVKAITDAEPSELFWEQLRRLSLQNSGVATLHGLKDYCSSLEWLDVSGNKVAQLLDLPISLRSLNISSNLVNDLTSWTHLHNLQYVNVSGNQLESLEGFSSLSHLRHLNASNNRVRDIEGILDLDGLISLDLSDNDIPDVDFRGTELSSLESLDLSNNSLMQIRNIDCLPKLKQLALKQNLLEELAIADGRTAPNLRSLDLSHNSLINLELTAFPALEALNVDHNNLRGLNGLPSANELRVLSARSQKTQSDLVNTLLTVPNDVVEMYISANALPASGLQLPVDPNYSLRRLEIASCGLSSLPSLFGQLFPNLRSLNLNFNALSDLSPLQGMIKLRSLFIARNRIQKMRRTCLALNRLPALKKIDARDNPLTVGFYAPVSSKHEIASDEQRPYCLAGRNREEDQEWIGLMDETTWLRRRAMELLLAQCCANLTEADGAIYDRAGILKERQTWVRLLGKGVLSKEGKENEKPVGVVVREVGGQDSLVAS